MALPDFSVVIAVYNGAQTIARAIESVIENEIELGPNVLVDGTGDDHTTRLR